MNNLKRISALRKSLVSSTLELNAKGTVNVCLFIMYLETLRDVDLYEYFKVEIKRDAENV